MFIIPDANVFLHYKSLEQLDLVEITGRSDIKVIVTTALLDELDERKYGNRAGLRDRAQRAICRIDGWLKDKAVKRGIPVVRVCTPETETFTSHRLNHNSKDDWYIASAIELKQGGEQAEVGIFSGDIGLRLRAADFDIEAWSPSEDAQLPPSDDPLRKENIKLKEQLVSLTLKQPCPSIRFQGGATEIVIVLPQSDECNGDTVDVLPEVKADAEGGIPETDSEVDTEKKPKERTPEERQQLISAISKMQEKLIPAFEKMKPFFEIPQEEEDRYSKEKQVFESDMREYEERYREVSLRLSRILCLNFELHNDGGSVAEEMRIYLVLPDYIEWRETDGRELLPSKPRPPTPPRNQMQLGGAGAYLIDRDILYGNQFPLISSPYDFDCLRASPNTRILACNGRNLEMRVDSCFHNNFIPLTEVFIEFTGNDQPSTFEIDTEIQELHTPDVLSGKLVVKIERSPSQSS